MFGLFNLKNKIINTFRLNLKRVAFEGISLTVILVFIFLILMVNILRVVQSGQNNYKIFNYEKDSLEELKRKNDLLSNELEATSTDEYKQLLAREVLGLAKNGEELFKVKQDVEFFEQEVILLNIEDKQTYLDWWKELVQ